MRKGLTLIETVIGVFLALLAATVILETLVACGNYSRRLEERTAATTLAHARMETLLAAGSSAVPVAQDNFGGNFSAYLYSVAIVPFPGAGNLKEIQLTVSTPNGSSMTIESLMRQNNLLGVWAGHHAPNETNMPSQDEMVIWARPDGRIFQANVDPSTANHTISVMQMTSLPNNSVAVGLAATGSYSLLWASDASANCIRSLPNPLTNPTGSWSAPDAPPGFGTPGGMVTLSNDDVWVTDRTNHAVWEKAYGTTWGSPIYATPPLVDPTSLIWNYAGDNLWVADSGAACIRHMGPGGWDAQGYAPPGGFSGTLSISLNEPEHSPPPDGFWVADSNNIYYYDIPSGSWSSNPVITVPLPYSAALNAEGPLAFTYADVPNRTPGPSPGDNLFVVTGKGSLWNMPFETNPVWVQLVP
jgi:hypothetical protein